MEQVIDMTGHRTYIVLCLEVLHTDSALRLLLLSIAVWRTLIALTPEVCLTLLETEKSISMVLASVVVIVERLEVLENGFVLTSQFDFLVLINKVLLVSPETLRRVGTMTANTLADYPPSETTDK